MKNFYTNERAARAAWTYIAEQRDGCVRPFLDVMGPVGALEWLMGNSHAIPPELQTVVADRKSFDDIIDQWRARLEHLDTKRDMELAAAHNASLLIPSDPQWPRLTVAMGQWQPIGIWVKGNSERLGHLGEKSVSIVGCRASSNYGNQACADIAWDLARDKWTVVSGGAFGIDSVAHKAALKAGGVTISVVAGGLDSLYPASHQDMFREIVDCGGAIASLHPPLTRPTRWRFLDRNRLIAGMTTGTVVVEAGLRSGALNTARHARDMGKYLGAVPGSLFSAVSMGTNRLIREGATLIRHGDDVKELMGPLGGVTLHDGPPPDGLWDQMSGDEKIVYDALPYARLTTVERLVNAAGLSYSRVQSALGGLEMNGFVQHVKGQWKRHTKQGSPTSTATQIG